MEKSCSECSEPTLAHSLCTLCNKWLCYQCTDVHQHHRAPATSQYTDMHEQQRTSAGGPASELHQRGSGSLPMSGQGPGSYPCSLLMCHSHRQEPLELFCESCDLLCCSSCHLSSHKTHRVVQIGKALQDQRWLFESLTVQVEERRSVVENSAKQIEDRVHEVKIAHRKAENQIKMAKMIMMNELNKRANLLIEQLEKISEDFQQRLEDQLQGAIEICGQLDHVQKFVTWAMTHHLRGPVLFSRTLISLQMQQLLESSLHSDSWSPVKIKFNWDASYWTKQISSLGQVTVEGGSCTHPQGMSCSNVIRPQPVTCLSLPSVCHRGRESGCGYQACCEPQMCCLHGIPSQPDLPSLDKSQLGASLYSSSCVAPSVLSASLLQSQHPQRCWDKNSSSALQPSSQCPPSTSPVPVVGSVQLSCSHGPSSQLQSAASQPPPPPQHKPYLYHQHQRGSLPDSLAQSNPEHRRPVQGQAHGQSQEALISAALQRELSHADVEHIGTPEENWEERRKMDEAHGQIQHDQLLDEELQQDKREQPRTRPTLMLRDHRNGRRSTSLEVSVTAHEHGSDVQRSRISPSSVCTRRKRRSQSIPAELAGPAGSPYTERPTGCAHRQKAGAGNRCASTDPRQRRASDGVLCVVKESSTETAFTRGPRSPLLCYKTEPDQSYLHEEADNDTKEKYSVSRDTPNSNRGIEKEAGRARVPVVCLERLKILVSQLPPPGRRQSDPLPASSTETSDTSIQKSTWHVTSDGAAGRTALLGSPYAERHTSAHSVNRGSLRSSGPALRSSDAQYELHSGSVHDVDSDSDPRSVSEEAATSQEDQEHDHRLDSDASPESDLNAESSSEGEFECPGKDKSLLAGTMGSPEQADLVGNSEASLEYDADPESVSGAGSDEGQELDAESADAETESDTQPEYDPCFQAETESDVSDQPLDSRGYVESELESEAELRTDDPQPLRSDLEEESPVGPGQRPLLIANPTLQREIEDVRPEEDTAEIESEDFCAVCLIGGDLLCCDRCPKVFHLSCHIPSLLSFPSGDWICSLCRNVVQPEVEYHCENERRSGEHASHNGLPACDQRKCERLTLLILSNILSAPFHEPVSPLARHYYQIIKRPMDLSVIRAKLSKRSSQHYNSPDQFVADVYLMFHNCAKFNYPDSEVAQAGRSLEAFFTSKLEEVFPDQVFQRADVDSDSDEYDEACRTAEGGFPWPERREQCHRKRKRRHSLKSRRHHF